MCTRMHFKPNSYQISIIKLLKNYHSDRKQNAFWYTVAQVFQYNQNFDFVSLKLDSFFVNFDQTRRFTLKLVFGPILKIPTVAPGYSLLRPVQTARSSRLLSFMPQKEYCKQFSQQMYLCNLFITHLATNKPCDFLFIPVFK